MNESSVNFNNNLYSGKGNSGHFDRCAQILIAKLRVIEYNECRTQIKK